MIKVSPRAASVVSLVQTRTILVCVIFTVALFEIVERSDFGLQSLAQRVRDRMSCLGYPVHPHSIRKELEQNSKSVPLSTGTAVIAVIRYLLVCVLNAGLSLFVGCHLSFPLLVAETVRILPAFLSLSNTFSSIFIVFTISLITSFITTSN